MGRNEESDSYLPSTPGIWPITLFKALPIGRIFLYCFGWAFTWSCNAIVALFYLAFKFLNLSLTFNSLITMAVVVDLWVYLSWECWGSWICVSILVLKFEKLSGNTSLNNFPYPVFSSKTPILCMLACLSVSHRSPRLCSLSIIISFCFLDMMISNDLPSHLLIFFSICSFC